MNSLAHGGSTSKIEVTNISAHGFWLLTQGRELFLPYEEFPWFKDQPVKAITRVEEPSRGHYRWPEIDVDLTEEIIKHPDRFPLKTKVT
jgi:hypothetical protein